MFKAAVDEIEFFFEKGAYGGASSFVTTALYAVAGFLHCRITGGWLGVGVIWMEQHRHALWSSRYRNFARLEVGFIVYITICFPLIAAMTTTMTFE
jgi:hypothetical protein